MASLRQSCHAGNLFGTAWPLFAQSLTMVVEGMGKTVDKVTTEVELGLATRDIPYEGTEDMDMPGLKGVIKKGTVAAQHHKVTAWADNKPFMTLHEMYSFIEHDAIEPKPDWDGYYHYRVVIEGDPGTELILRGIADAQGEPRVPRLHLDRDGTRERDSRRLRRRAGVHEPQRTRTDALAGPGTPVADACVGSDWIVFEQARFQDCQPARGDLRRPPVLQHTG